VAAASRSEGSALPFRFRAALRARRASANTGTSSRPRAFARTGVTAGFGYQVHHSQIWEGGGVFQVGEDDPEDLEDVFPEMREPALQRKHEARIQPVYDAHARSLYWALGGLAAMGTGIGIAAAIQDDSPTGAAVAGISGLGLGLVGVFGALAAQPSGEEQLAADAREQLFIPSEDDMKAAARGVDRMNAAQRSRCQ
jgi:hypothetical protein